MRWGGGVKWWVGEQIRGVTGGGGRGVGGALSTPDSNISNKDQR